MAARWRIFVEDKELDPGDDLSAQFTYSIDDIKNFASRNTSFSKTIVLPGTATNKRTFGHVFEIGSGNFYDSSQPNIGYNYNASKSAKCIVTLDNIQIFKGVIRILEIVYDGPRMEFETAVFGELGGLIAAIGDKRLEDLDFSAYDHTFNVTNISNSWSSTPGSGYYYPLIDYGFTTDGINYPIENFRPALHVKEYLDKIIGAAGYTYNSTFLNSSFFKKLIVPHNGKQLFQTVSTALDCISSTYTPSGTGYELISFGTVSLNTFFTYSAANKNIFTWTEEDTIIGLTGVTLSWSRSTTTAQVIQVRVTKNDQIVVDKTFNTGSATSGSIDAREVISIANGDYIKFYVANSQGSTLTYSFLTGSVQGQPDIKLRAIPGNTISVNDCIPKNVFQKDFLKWLIQAFNLYIYEDKDTDKLLNIEPYVNFYDTNTANARNWDGKLDLSQTRRIKPLGEFNSRVYEFKYKDDSDYYNELYKNKWGQTYGTLFFDTGNDFSNDKQTIEIGFSPSPLIQFNNTDRVLTSIIKSDGITRTPTESNIRLLLRSSSALSCASWSILTTTISSGSSSTSTNNYITYPYSGHLDDPDAPSSDINFGAPNEFFFTIVAGYLSANLFNVFWSFYISEISDKDSKIFSGFFKLNPVDIYTLDFSKLVFFAGEFWRLNLIEDYSTDQPNTTRCEFLKVIDIV